MTLSKKQYIPFIVSSYNFLVHKIIYGELKEVAPMYACGILLDIGCGEKPYKRLFASYIIQHIGPDHKETLHDKSRVDLWGTACDILVKDESFDTVVCTAVLEHLEEPDKALKGANRVLKKAGCCIYTVFLLRHLHVGLIWRTVPAVEILIQGICYLLKINHFEGYTDISGGD